jgi:hypothetical protein
MVLQQLVGNGSASLVIFTAGFIFHTEHSIAVRMSRGRPQSIDDDALQLRRADLLATFEWQWSDFAWELERAKNIRGIRRALQPVRECRGIKLFTYEPTSVSNWAGLRSLRQKLARLSPTLRAATRDEERCREKLDRVLGALRDVGSDARLEAHGRKRKAEHDSSLASLESLCDMEHRLRDELHGREAYISQSELLLFITGKRYTINPGSLANAMSGLPFIGWRHSAARCNTLAPDYSVGLSHQILEILRRALAQPPRTSHEAIEKVKAHLLKGKTPYSQAARVLCAHWYYLRSSIEAVYQKRPPKTSLPFRVHSEYRRRSRSRYDQIMEDVERLGSLR